MKKILVVAMLVLAVAVGAQDLRTNNRAILFTFGGLADLGLYNYNAGPATGIGAKIFNAAGTMAYRPCLLFGMSSSEQDPDIDDYVGEKESASSFGVMFDVIKHLNKNNITPYVGGGAGFLKQSESTESGHMEDDDPNETKSSISGLTLRGILGVEWFVKKNISLAGEYRLSFTKGSQENKAKGGGADEWDKMSASSTNIGIGSSGLFTIAIYLQ